MGKANPIVIGELNKGGIAESDYFGYANSVAESVGLNIHDEAGIIKVNQKLKKDSGDTITELCKCIVDCSDGNTYFFSSESGKVWKRTSAGVYSSAYTVSATSGQSKILGAKEYGGFLYFFTQNYAHRIDVSKTSDWSSNAEANWKPMCVDQAPIGGLGLTTDIAASIAEDDEDKQVFFPRDGSLSAIDVYIEDAGTGNWTVTVHNSSNTSQGTKTIANGSLTEGQNNLFVFASALSLNPDEEYHVHITSTVADGTVASISENDLSTAAMTLYASGDTDIHHCVIQNLKLFISDRNFVHQINSDVNGHVFTAAALDIPKPQKISCLGTFSTSVVVGTKVSNNINKAYVYRWDTWSPSFLVADDVSEQGINAFINADNVLYISAGIKGNLYSYDGARLELLRSIKGDYSSTQRARINPNAVTMFKGYPMFGVSNEAGNPCSQGVYSYVKKGYYNPPVLNLEYPLSQRGDEEYDLVLSDFEIGAMEVVGTDLVVTWKYTGGTSDTYGVDIIDNSNKVSGAYFVTRLITMNRDMQKTFNEFISSYRSLPAGSNIQMSYKDDYSASWKDVKPEVTDDIRKTVRSTTSVRCNVLQVKVELRVGTDTNTAPEIEDLRINLNSV